MKKIETARMKSIWMNDPLSILMSVNLFIYHWHEAYLVKHCPIKTSSRRPTSFGPEIDLDNFE